MASSASPKLAGSGSIQSHLSTANQRLRPSTSVGSAFTSTELDTLHKNHRRHNDPNLLSSSFSALGRNVQNFFFSIIFQPAQSDESLGLITTLPNQHPQQWWLVTCTRTVILFYFCFSIVFTSVMIYSKVEKRSLSLALWSGPIVLPPFLPVNILSDPQKLSRLLPLQLSAVSTMLSPYLLRGTPTGFLPNITLCLWEDESNATTDAMTQLTSQWRGQVSLLLLTPPDLPSHHALLERLETWKNHSSLSSVSVHALQLSTHPESYSPNALLNLARLLAPTPKVLLFPGNLASSSNQVAAEIPFSEQLAVNWAERPLLYPSNTSLPTLLIARDHVFWCTERHFFLNTRQATWNECLWQLWVNSYGRLDHFNFTSTNDGTIQNGHTTNDLTEEMHKRLSSRFRSEICDLNIKWLTTSASPPSRSEMGNLRWLRQFCRQVLDDNRL